MRATPVLDWAARRPRRANRTKRSRASRANTAGVVHCGNANVRRVRNDLHLRPRAAAVIRPRSLLNDPAPARTASPSTVRSIPRPRRRSIPRAPQSPRSLARARGFSVDLVPAPRTGEASSRQAVSTWPAPLTGVRGLYKRDRRRSRSSASAAEPPLRGWGEKGASTVEFRMARRPRERPANACAFSGQAEVVLRR